ncbi:MAG: hypothetical protein FJ096_08340 [Deltaproteobacteria bacterium]|nr:hypothetical protein [Deltaproteobacteria bacterium]
MAHARALATLLATAGLTVVTSSRGEDPRCLSPDPGEWPAPSRPYFMLAVDTSASMVACTTPPTSFPNTCAPFANGYAPNVCGLEPTRLNDAKCALYESVLAFGGQVNFGLATYAVKLASCPDS